ncbi:MAG: multicopper oxidase family protein [Rhodospirillales bacterium]|nr:multicopper oxidase family protein [Rhodospirillales bacterium]
MPHPKLEFNRREVLLAGAGAALAGVLGLPPAAAAVSGRLTAKPGRVQLVGPSYPETEVWCYGGRVPGPELRVRQGGRLSVAFDNRLPQSSTVHWHGLRVPNAMDGVPELTQAPVAPGEVFAYEFDLPDAGTYWYHPHQGSVEQVGRGLYGPLIVEEPEPIRVDREVVWVLDDWRMTQEAAIVEDFDNFHDHTHSGRIGNTVTVNGAIPETFPVRAGERIRLRLINAANARFFALKFTGHAPRLIALDGQPCVPHALPGGRIVLGPAMRADLVIDMSGRPGERFQVVDDHYRRFAYGLLEIVYEAGAPLREHPLDAPVALPANPLPAPDLGSAVRQRVVLGGGAMGGLASATFRGETLGLREIARAGKVWALNGVVADRLRMDPLLILKRGQSAVIELVNESAFDHPMHLHGHSFRVLSRDGRPVPHGIWQDTVLVAPREKVEIGFVADNPGDWLFHCHILEHMAAGMMGVLRVA